MNPQPQDTQLTRPGLPHPAMVDGAWALGAPTFRREEADQPQPLHKVHGLLRGRYKLAVTLALVLGVGLAVAGYLVPKPQYRSDGLIEVKPNIPSLKDTTIVMPLYTQYIESQVSLILGQRVISGAMSSAEWRPFSEGLSPKAMKDFVEKLDAEYVRGTFMVRVSFTDPNPDRAQAAVKAVIWSYRETYKDEDTYDLKNKIQLVENMISSTSLAKKGVEKQLREAPGNFGAVDNGELQSACVRELISLKERQTQAELSLASAQAALGQGNAPGQAHAATQPSKQLMTYAQLAKIDPRIQVYVTQRDDASDAVDKLRARLGHNHPMVMEAEKRLDSVQGRLDALATEVRAQDSGLQITADGREGTAATPQMVEQLKTTVAFLKDKVGEATTRLNKVVGDNANIQSLQAQIKDCDEKLADANRTLDQLNVQLSMSGRVLVRSEGDKPVIPTVDRRRQAAILGFLGGGSIPFVVFLLIGLADKRYRYSDETKTEIGNVPLLGILPNLPDLLTDPQQAAIAAHCVHQIRTLLQVGVRTHDRHVYAVTSAAPGDGKTSLTLALGLSFAASGSRTLLIDCDLVGGSLTRRLGVHSAEGMLEAMGSRSPMDYVRDTDVSDLSILPVGSATMLSAGSFSPAGLRRLIAEARKAFDIVLIDTGPILGSIEAPPVAATADATILCVSRGQQRPAVERSMHHLIAIGAKMAGIVFNRAEASDFEKSVSRFSQRSIRATGDYRNGNGGNGGLRLPGKTDPEGKASAGVDPVTRAVASDFKGDNGNDPR